MNRAEIFIGQNLPIAPGVARFGYGAMVLYSLISMVLLLAYGFAGIVVRTAIVLSG